MSLSVPSNKYICIDYPGIVNDDTKALETLGTETQLFKIFNDKRKRLELKFRPNEESSKGIYGDYSSCNAIVLKVSRKKNAEENGYLRVEILAYVSKVYSFKTLCDYQYQPIERIGSSTEYRSLQPFLTFNGFKKSSWLFEKNVPCFLPSSQYSRIDKQTDMKKFFTGQGDLDKVVSSTSKDYLSCKIRKFNEPCPKVTDIMLSLIEELSNNPYTKSDYQRVKEQFDRIPVWTINSLTATVKLDSTTLKKKFLAALAYYFMDGPWGRAWIRYGFDPLIDFSAKIYQTINVRFIRDSLQRKALKGNSVKTMNLLQEEIPEENYRFIPDVHPTSCHVLYLIGDVQHVEIQNLLHSNDGKESVLTERDGWLPTGTIEKCRTILKSHFKLFKENKKRELFQDNDENDEDNDEENNDQSNSDDPQSDNA